MTFSAENEDRSTIYGPGFMDLQNADGNEGNALLDRNIFLRELARSKPCAGFEGWPAQPKRYT